MMPKLYSKLKNRPARAQQVYTVLVGLAHNRQTITYGQLADILGFGGAGVFAGILGHIMFWCEGQGLPPLTVLVVNGTTGLPGAGLITPEDVHADRERVFAIDWYDVVPPSPEELAAAAGSHIAS